MVHASYRDESGLEGVEQFVEHAPIPIQRLAPDGTVLQANQALLDLLGYERTRYVGRLFGDFHADPGVMTDMLTALTNHEAVSDMPARLRCREAFYPHLTCRPAGDDLDGAAAVDALQYMHTCRCARQVGVEPRR